MSPDNMKTGLAAADNDLETYDEVEREDEKLMMTTRGDRALATPDGLSKWSCW